MKQYLAMGLLCMSIMLAAACGEMTKDIDSDTSKSNIDKDLWNNENTGDRLNSENSNQMDSISAADEGCPVSELPDNPPEIIISIEGRSLDYMAVATSWNGVKDSKPGTKEAFTELTKDEKFIPTYVPGGITETGRMFQLDFGAYVPETILVADMMLTDSGGLRYTQREIMNRTVERLDEGRVQFGLSWHVAFYLSSNSADYEKDWYRMFMVTCGWNDHECIYVFLINTDKEDEITEIQDRDLLVCEGEFSKLSSDWGIGLGINPDQTVLPDRYVVEWQAIGGTIRKWNSETLEPQEITKVHNGYPMTEAFDENQGEVIWSPTDYTQGEEILIKAFIYEAETDKTPIAYSEVTLTCDGMTWREKPYIP